MKRILAFALLLVISLSFILTSCGNGDETTTGAPDDDTTTTANNNNVDGVNREELEEKVEKALESKHKLTFNDDGSFRVLILADIHMNTSADATKVQAVKDRIKLLVDREKPDLVIFTGDNTINSSTEAILRDNISAMVSYIEEKKIPWCHVYGNHDHENALSKEEQHRIYQSYEYCVSKDNPADIYISGVGNYVNAVYNKDGTVGAVIYCLDSGTYMSSGVYDYIKASQIGWYKETSQLLKEYNGGKAVPAIMAFHIPLKENTTAYENRDNKEIVLEYTGERNENICSSTIDTNLLETVFECGDVKAIVTGHDHVNDYMYNYKGVKLASSPNFSDLTYTNASVQGARVFDLNLSTVNNVTTYVSYIVDRLNPDEYGTLSSNISLEYTKEEVDGAIITGWNSAGLTGNAELSLVDGKGAGGSNALKIVRDDISNFEMSFRISNAGKLGDNKYLIVWADFTGVEFRKACFGLLSTGGHAGPYRTDDADYKSPIYYLADGSSQWTEFSHGTDGCFGVGDNGSQGVMNMKGYFAVPIDNLRCGSKTMTGDSLISGFYFYGSLNSGSSYNVPFYMDDIRLVTDYKNFSAN